MKTSIALLIAGVLSLSATAEAKTVTGSVNGLSYIASNAVVGQTSTASVVGGGDPLYLAQDPMYRGVVGLLIDEGSAGQFACSGSLSSDRRSIITAGHCVSDGASSVQPTSVTAFFYNGNATDPYFYDAGAAGVTPVGISQVYVNPLYTGEVIDDHDIAVLRLASAAPSYAQGYSLYNGADLTGLTYNVAGYGDRSDGGGSIGGDLDPGRLRQGDNRYDFRLGDPDFLGEFAGEPNGGYFGTAETDYSYLSDFDNGLVAQDASCKLASLFGASGSKYCNTGLGEKEVSIAGGDSGGPEFVNGMLASITGFNLTFGTGLGDTDKVLNETFGEFNGFIPVAHNLDFINAALAAPEPGTWGMMVFGFGMIGGGLRRTRKARVA